MRIAVRHETHYTYATPPKSIIQLLRLTPRSHEGQHVISWRIDCDADCKLKCGEDAFGNITHTFTVSQRVSSLSLIVEGNVETFDTAGVIRHAVERFPPTLYLRDTSLTEASAEIEDLGKSCLAKGPLDGLHELMARIHAHMQFDKDPTHTATTAKDAWSLARGVCQDYAHVFIAAARAGGIPTRYVSGHFFRDDGVVEQEAGHAWAEAYVADLGWVGFDPANCICPHESHVRVACGLDYLDAAPVRGAQNAGAGESLKVNVAVSQARSQRQN
jgi:transglutaminase-like putative cysteine protease